MSILSPLSTAGLPAALRLLAQTPTTPTPPVTQPTTAPAETALLEYVILAVATTIAVAVAIYLGVWRPGRVSGPLRIQPGRPAWPLLLVFLAGGTAWLGMQVVYVAVLQAQLMKTHGPTAKLDPAMLTAQDYAFLAVVPGSVAFLCLVVGDLLAGRWTLAWLGMDRRRLTRGLLQGAGAFLLVLPCVYCVSVVAEWAYQKVGFKHPPEHDLLRVIKSADSRPIEWMLIAGAVLVAPFFEELLFRGHLQTLLRHAFIWLSRHTPAPAIPPPPPPPPMPAPQTAPDGNPFAHAMPPFGFPPPPPGYGPAGVVPAAYAPVPYAPPTTPSVPVQDGPPRPIPPAVWQGWLAILLASCAFAAVHDPWTWPPIFFLSLVLGYVYERTGNLWVSITVHALFNATSTVIYILFT